MFPAYASKHEDGAYRETSVGSMPPAAESGVSTDEESRLLASDASDDADVAARPRLSQPPPPPLASQDFYLDAKLDRGNLAVSTLYYPGRPQYRKREWRRAAGAERGAPRERGARYYSGAGVARDPPPHRRGGERRRAPLGEIEAAPLHLGPRLRYLDHLERGEEWTEMVRAAEEAIAAIGTRGALRARLDRALRGASPAGEYLERLRRAASGEREGAARVDLWARLALGAAAAPGCEAPAVLAVTRAALADVRRVPAAYPTLLYVYGTFLRAAGLAESVTLLTELAWAMNLCEGDAAAFPPPPDRQRARRREEALRRYEDECVRSGLPLSVVWARVERARGEAHWRSAAADGAGEGEGEGEDEDEADPQRRPAAHEVADLLLPVAAPEDDFLLLVNLLRLAKVPLLPQCGWAVRAVCGPGGELDAGDGGAELLLALGAAGVEAGGEWGAAVRAVADPPHYLHAGEYRRWVHALWEAGCARHYHHPDCTVALLCWRLRWTAALLAVSSKEELETEAPRARAAARAALRRFAGESPLPFAEFARLEAAAGGGGEGGAAERVALRALRAALRRVEGGTAGERERERERVEALYAARCVCAAVGGGEAGEGRGARTAVGRRALVCAALGVQLSLDTRHPDPEEVARALQVCEERCSELERQYEAEEESGECGAEEEAAGWGGAAARGSLLPSTAEWGAVRALLAPPARLAQLRRDLVLRATLAAERGSESSAAARYREQSAAAVCCAGGGAGAMRAARQLAPLFPHNAVLARLSAAAPLWCGAPRPPDTRCAVMAALAPPLLRAVAARWPPAESSAVARLCRRVSRGEAGGGCGAVWAARLLAGGGEGGEGAPHRLPHHKWLYVRAAPCGGEGGALPDALLDRQLRLRALPQELLPPTDPMPIDDDRDK